MSEVFSLLFSKICNAASAGIGFGKIPLRAHFGNAIDMGEMMEKMPKDILTMGNTDPAGVLLNGTVETVKAETQKLMENCAKYPNFLPQDATFRLKPLGKI